MPDPYWQKRLEEILRPQGVRYDANELRQSGWDGPLPGAIGFPNSREQVCEVMRLASADRLKVTPFGCGSKLRMGGIPQLVDLALSLERLNRVCDYPANDLTISVEAGLPIRDLARTLTEKGQMLPLDVPFADEATVGGTVAANINGPRRLGYGSWRDIVLGVQFVTGEGKLAKGGGKVVKNVAGYDIPKLLIGSFGTIGVIVEITFKVFPIPPASATIALQFRTVENACRAANHILHSPLLPQSLDLADAAAGTLSGVTMLRSAPFTLLAGVAGPQEVLARFERELPALVRGDGLENFSYLRSEQETATWNCVQNLTPSFLHAHSNGCVVKASLPLAEMGGYLSRSRQKAEESSSAVSIHARVGSGVAYLHLYPDPGDTNGERIGKATGHLISDAEHLGGRAIVEWCPAEWKSKMNLWGATGDDLPWMRKLKAALDPQGILNSGRFYGGI